MSELFKQSPLVQTTTPAPLKNSSPSVPPPPSIAQEVTIRTLASDLALMGQGTRPTVQNIPTLTVALGAKSPIDRSQTWIWFTVGGVGVLVLFFLGYYLLPMFFGKAKPQIATPSVASSTPSLPTSTTSQTVSFVHQSFFRIAPDTTLPVNLALPSAVPQSDLQKIQAALSSSTLSASVTPFTEVTVTDANGGPLTWPKFLTIAAIPALSPDFWQTNFEQDLTFFMYTDKLGSWPGYILKLQPGRSPLVLQTQLLKIENTTASLGNLFLISPGVATSSFTDAQVNGQPVRMLVYPKPGAALVYGWSFNQYLIISTSLEGYRQAVSHL